MKHLLAVVFAAAALIPATPAFSQNVANPSANVAARQADILSESLAMGEDDPGFLERVQWVVDNASALADAAENLLARTSDALLDTAVQAEKAGVKEVDNIAFKHALTHAEAARFVRAVGNGFNISGTALQFATAEDKWRATSEICMGALFATLSGGNPAAEVLGEYIGGAVYDFDPVGKFVYDPLIYDQQWSKDFADWLYERQYGENPHLQDNVREKAERLEKDETGRYRLKDADAADSARRADASEAEGSGTGFPPSLETFLSDQLSDNPNVQEAFDDLFDKVRIGLDTVLDAETAQTVADKLEELAARGIVAAGGAVDRAVQAQIDKLRNEILSYMPGDASKAQMGRLLDDVLAGVGSGDFSAAVGDIPDLGASLAGDYASKLVDKLNLPAEEKAALKKTVSDAVQAYINDTGVGASIQGNVESYVYRKIKSQFGQDVADSWKQAYQTWQGGANPWADIKAAAKKTIETWAFDKLEKVVGSQLKKLLEKHPVLAETFKALGIDAHSIVVTARNIWGVLTGPGTFKDKLQTLSKMAVEGLANMLKSLVQWGIGKLQNWLNGVMSKIGKTIATWIQNLLGDKFHLSQKIVDMAMKAVNAAIGAGVKAVVALPSKLEPVAGKWIDKGATKVNEIIDDAFNPPPAASATQLVNP